MRKPGYRYFKSRAFLAVRTGFEPICATYSLNIFGHNTRLTIPPPDYLLDFPSGQLKFLGSGTFTRPISSTCDDYYNRLLFINLMCKNM